MMGDVIRLYQHGRFSNIVVPDWFEEAMLLSERESVGWHRAVSRSIGAEHQGLTMEATGPIELEISFWHSQKHGVYVEIDSGLEMIEQVLVGDTAEWLPFMSAHLTPLLAAVSQAETARQLKRVANALISFGRHGHGRHIHTWTAHSRIDEQEEEDYRARLRAKAGK